MTIIYFLCDNYISEYASTDLYWIDPPLKMADQKSPKANISEKTHTSSFFADKKVVSIAITAKNHFEHAMNPSLR